jgi:uncharacterized membrane protein
LIALTSFSLLIGIVITAFVSIIFAITPYFTPPYIQFGVRIPDGHESDISLKSIRLKFLISELALMIALIALFLIYLNGISPLVSGILPLFDIILSFLIYLKFHYSTLKLKSDMQPILEQAQVSTAVFVKDSLGVRHIALLLPWVELGIFIAIGIYRYPFIPNTFPIHFGANGQPNGYATKSIESVFSVILLVGVPINVLFSIISLAVLRVDPFQNPRSPVKTRMQMSGFNRINFYLMPAIALVVNLTLFVSSATIWGMLSSSYVFIAIIPVIAILPAIIIIGMKVGQTGWKLYPNANNSEDGVTARDDDSFWKGGVIYFNRNDSSIMVPKRFGYGYTLNFAHPVTWILFAAPFIVLVVILAVVIHIL